MPGSAATLFPIDNAIGTIHFGAAQLSQVAPLQYQEYDRTCSEAEFRLAVVPPLVALSVVAPIPGRAWLILVTLAGCLILLSQAVAETRASNDILANAALLEYITIPAAQAAAEYVKGLDARPQNDGEWLGSLVAGLDHRGYFEESEAAIQELAHWNDEDLATARQFLVLHCPDSVPVLDRSVKLLGESERT